MYPDLLKLTRARAEKLVAQTTDIALLEHLARHRNSHVQVKAKHKLAAAAKRKPTTAASNTEEVTGS